jgi:hypothetical protein
VKRNAEEFRRGTVADIGVPRETANIDELPETPAKRASAASRRRLWDRRWSIVALLTVGFLVQLAWRMWLAHPLYTPVVLGDESRYLVFARALVGGPGGYGGDTEATRRAGYALLISPMYWFTDEPFAVYRLVQTLNAVINALTFPLAYLFTRRVLGTDRRWAVGVAFVAASLPAVAFFAPFALPNAVLTPLLLGWLLTLHGWITGRTAAARLYAAAGAGAIVGFMYVIHIRALLLLGVHALVAVGLLVARRVRPADVLASGVCAAVAMSLHAVLKAMLKGKVITGGTEPENRMVEAFTTVDGILRTVSDGTGQIWYLCVGTWGLAAIGLVVTGYRLARRRDLTWPTGVVLASCLASTLLIALITSAALPADGKVNNHVYPGYIIFVAPVWVMTALAALRGAGWRVVTAAGAGAAGLILVAWFVVDSYTRPLRPLGRPQVFSAIDAPEVLFLAGDWEMIHLAQVTLVALGMVAVVVALMAVRRPALPAVLMLVAATAVNVVAMKEANSRMEALATAQYATGPQLVRQAGIRPGEVVVCDTHVLARFNHQREVYWRPMPLIDLRYESPPSDADVVVSPWRTGDPELDWDGAAHDWNQLAGDPIGHWALWRRKS